MTTRPTRAAALGLAGLALATLCGCGGSSGSAPTAASTAVSTQADADAVAMQAALAFLNVSSEAGAGADVLGDRTAPLSARLGGATGAATGAPLVGQNVPPLPADTTFQRGNVTFILLRQWFDLQGAPQLAPSLTTDSIAVIARAFGTDSTTSTQFRVTVGHAGRLEAGGLNPVHDTVHLDGDWADTLSSHFTALTGGTVDCYARTHGVATAIQFPKAASYPSAGTIVWTVFAERLRNGLAGSVDKTLEATVTLTFNGTRYPVLTVNGSWSYTWDLDGHLLARAGAA